MATGGRLVEAGSGDEGGVSIGSQSRPPSGRCDARATGTARPQPAPAGGPRLKFQARRARTANGCSALWSLPSMFLATPASHLTLAQNRLCQLQLSARPTDGRTVSHCRLPRLGKRQWMLLISVAKQRHRPPAHDEATGSLISSLPCGHGHSRPVPVSTFQNPPLFGFHLLLFLYYSPPACELRLPCAPINYCQPAYFFAPRCPELLRRSFKSAVQLSPSPSLQ